MSNAEVVQTLFDAYLAGAQAAAEPVVAAGLTFTSPQDDHIDRAAYFERCFPTAARLASQTILVVTEVSPDDVFLMYEYELTTGEVHRNTELITVRDGQVQEIQVFFGGRVR